MDALVVEEVLYFNEVHAHLDHLLHKGLLALSKEVNFLLVASKRALLRKLLLNLALAGLVRRHRHDVPLLEEVEELSWDFL